MNKNEKRIIPRKNYYLLVLLVVVTLSLLYFSVNWYYVYEENRIGESVIASIVPEVKEEELSNYLMDNPNIVIYFASAKDKETKSFEKKLKKYISEEELKDQIVYVNTDEIVDKSFYQNFISNYFNSELKNKKISLEYLPNMVTLRDGKVQDVLVTYDSNVTVDDVKRFLEKNEVVEK